VTRVLGLIESAPGGQVLGHAGVASTLSVAAAERADTDLRLVGLPPLSRAGAAAIRGLPGLNRLDLDLQATRWHVLQSARARRTLLRALAGQPADVAMVVSHAIALLTRGVPVPVVPSVDVPVWAWRAMGIWRAVRPYSRQVLAASLALERRALTRAPLVHAWSEWTQREIRAAAPGARTFACHPGIDLERLRPAPRDPRDRPRVLFVGGRFRAKGGFDLIEALTPLLGADAELDVVTPADVPSRPGLRVHRLDSSDPRLVALYQQADVLCLPTYGDAVPLVVVEAMACGTPVVATDIGAIRELIDDERAGVLVRAGDVAGLRGALVALLEDDDRRAALGAHGRQRCEERYDARRQGAEILDRLAGVAGAPSSAATSSSPIRGQS
jgi:glycosyltransferase involved in cell wall biosynthesis